VRTNRTPKRNGNKIQVFIRSFGCASNIADGEVLASCLGRSGFNLVQTLKDANIVIFNTCAVKGPTEDRMIELLRKVPKDKFLIVAGCLPLINWQRLQSEVRFNGVVGPAAGERIVEVVNRVLNGEHVVCLDEANNAMPQLKAPLFRVNPVVSIVPVCYGCLGICTYCCVRFARRQLRSYTPQKIVNRIHEDLRQGVREVWLTGQDLSVYGFDLSFNLADLLRTIFTSEYSADFWVRMGMMTPKGLISEDFSLCKQLCNAYSKYGGEKNNKKLSHGHLFWFLHIPVQSGDDEVLKLMKRGYTVSDFKRVVESFRLACPNISLATDVIVGFPSESEEAFHNTLRLLEEIKPDIVNVSKFFPRPRTEAALLVKTESKLKVKPKDIKIRSEMTSKVVRRIALEKNKTWINWEGLVLIDEQGKTKGTWIGRNYAYKPIVLKSQQNLLGKSLHVRIIDAYHTYLLGEIIENR